MHDVQHGSTWVRHTLPRDSAQELSATYEHQHQPHSWQTPRNTRSLLRDVTAKAPAVNESQLLASHLLTSTDIAVCVCIKDQWPDTWEWIM